jgi:polyisoprenoid-binding protein YceI
MGPGTTRAAAAGAALALLACLPATAAEPWRVAQGDLRITVPLKPGGGFEAKSNSLAGSLTLSGGSPVALTGELAVDLKTIDTGIELRNQHLREKYLEVAKAGFDKAVLSEIRLADATGETFDGKTGFTATLRLHGVSRPVSGNAEVRHVGDAVRVVVSFPLTLTDFAIEAPQYMGVGVGTRLGVKVAFTAAHGAGK